MNATPATDERSRHIRLAIPVVAGVAVGLASLVPPSYPMLTLLQTLVIAQASLLAIVISVAIMSLQVSTNRFAPQLSQLYRESSFNTIVARFGVSILFDLLLFAVPAAWVAQTFLRAPLVAVGIALASWAFVSLLEIEERLLVFLNPEPVLDSLVESVSFERYHDFSRTRREAGQVTRNPLLEILQVAQTSFEQNDNYSALRAVDAFDEATERLLSEFAALPATDRREKASSVHKLFDYWNQLADIAVAEGADDTLHAILDAELAIGRRAVDLDLEAAGTGSVDALYHFCAVTLANNRFEPEYHEALGSLLSESIDDGMLDIARRAVTDLARLSTLVDRREDDLLVAQDERVSPHREFLENWAHFLDVHQERLESEPCRSLYAHFEDEYHAVRTDGEVDGTGVDRAVGWAGLRAVGVAAASADLQWAVSRTTEAMLALAASTERSGPDLRPHLEAVLAAGGRPGVEDARRRLRARHGPTTGEESGEPATEVVDPLSDRREGAGAGPHRPRPLDRGGSPAALASVVDRLDEVLGSTGSP